MRVEWEILLFIFLLNLSVGLIISLSLPGTAYVNPTNPTNASEYEKHFNASEIEQWGSTPFSGIPLIGDIFAGFQFFVRNIGFLFDGFPTLLTWLKDSYITDSSGALAFDVIANTLRAIYALLIATFLIEFISGRYISD